MRKKLSILLLSIILVLIILSTTTYALFYKQDKLVNTENYTAGILDIVLDNDKDSLGDVLNLANSIPLSDTKGKATTPYKFKITNQGNLSYIFDLKILSTTLENTIDSSYIKVMIDDDEPVLLSSLTDGIIKRKLKLESDESIIIEIRIWLSEDTKNTEIGKTFSAKIVSEGVGREYISPNASDLVEGLVPITYSENKWIKADSNNLDYTWYNYKDRKWANAVL